MNEAAIPCPVEDVQGDNRWMNLVNEIVFFFFFFPTIIFVSNSSIFDVFFSLQHQRFVLETKEREPEILFVGDSLISHLIYTDMWETMFAPLHPVRKSLLLPSPSKHTNTTLFVFIPVKLWHRWRPQSSVGLVARLPQSPSSTPFSISGRR